MFELLFQKSFYFCWHVEFVKLFNIFVVKRFVGTFFPDSFFSTLCGGARSLGLLGGRCWRVGCLQALDVVLFEGVSGCVQVGFCDILHGLIYIQLSAAADLCQDRLYA